MQGKPTKAPHVASPQKMLVSKRLHRPCGGGRHRHRPWVVGGVGKVSS